jgi:hypothetical protein
MSFTKTNHGSIALWRGNPDCLNGQQFVREWLRENSPAYPTIWVPENTRLKGNLGECIAFCCAMLEWNPAPHCLAANAFKTLGNISRSEIDLLWIGFGQTAQDDFVIHQEVKTTTALNLAYSVSLLDDYKKSFGPDPYLTLNTHLQAVKSKLKYEWQRPDLVNRVNALQSHSPAAAHRLTIVPTLVHDIQSEDPIPKLAAVEAELKTAGWLKIEAWSIGFDGLEAHLKCMAEDAP